MIISYLLMMLLIISTLGENCDYIMCANIFDEVCGIAKLKDGTQITMIYKNICYMRKKACELESFVEISQVADELCNMEKSRMRPRHDKHQDDGRRVNDFSIVGAHQACNHSCPIHCTDSFEPACAQIWKSNMKAFTYRPMINHCHIDLFSCAVGVNVTIHHLSKCYTNPSDLLFMRQLAALKSFKFIDSDPTNVRSRRRTNVVLPDVDNQTFLKKHLEKVIRRIFEKYNSGFDQDEAY